VRDKLKATGNIKSIKILYVIRQLGLGGTEKRMAILKNYLESKFEIEVHSLTGYQKEYSIQVAGNNERNKYHRLALLHKKIQSFKPDLIHAFDLESGLYTKFTLLMSGKIRIPIISGYGASFIENTWIKWLLSCSLLNADLYVCNSEKGKHALEKFVKNKVITIHNGLSPTDFKNGKVDPDTPDWASANRPVIGYIGKLDGYKHGERMVEIAVKLQNHPLNPVFVVIGSGPNEITAKKRLKEYPELAEKFFFLGLVEEAHKLARYFDLGILCSDTEGFPNVILEYMALGVPCISTDVGDVKEILEDGRAGIIVNQYDTKKFVEAIELLLYNDTLRKNLTETAKNRFLRYYTLETMCSKYQQVYHSLLSVQN
jgi:glycosyltransferase involved in cell wall biosynthesis